MKKILLCVIFFSIMFLPAVIVSAEEYDLTTYLAMVEKNNPDLLVMFKDIELTKTDIALSRSMFLPHAGLQGGYNRNLTERLQSMPVASQPGGGQLVYQDVRTNYDNELNLGIGISQILYSAGAISNYNKAKLGQAIREQSYEAARQVIFCAAKKLYARAQLVLLVVEIRESSEHFSLEQYQRVQRRHSVGAATEMDLLLAEVDWRTKTDAVMEAKKNSELVLLAFRDLAGIPHTEYITLTQEHNDLPEIPETPTLGAVLSNRADYNALLLSRDLNDVERKAAQKAFLPEVSASLNYALGGMGNKSSLTGDYDFNSAALGIIVKIPISTGGARLARMKAAKLQQERTAIALSQRETAIESEILELLLRLEDSNQRIESSYRTVETARRAVTLAQTAYSNGQATYLNVMDAQDKLDMVWLNFANIGFEYLSAHYDWQLATGIK
ncbi:MAG: TolC family protein [Spirochaetaceae bacterium]|nr:TolC family protein [Spirochaetaceae bacterium]